MASFAKTWPNWTILEDEKILDLLIKQKAQASTQFEWSVVKPLLKSEGNDGDATQIRNHYNDMLKKLKARKWLLRGTSVGVDYNRGCEKDKCYLGQVSSRNLCNRVTLGSIPIDSIILFCNVCNNLLLMVCRKWGGNITFFERVLTNLEKMKVVFRGSCAIDEMSFSCGMVVSSSKAYRKNRSAAIDMKE